jgi:anti-sigma regulatory factor (Ser/Thr protein kinase)
LLRPQWIWGAFLPAEALAAGVFWFLQRNYERREIQWQYPMCRVVLTNSSHELGNVVEMISAFCEEHEVPMAKAIQLQLAVEEICSVTIQKAFSGQEDEYIQVTLVLESPSRYVLHIRDSAPYFNPLDLRMEKARKDMESSIMDSIGVMMVRKQSSRMIYQNYQGFNTLTVVYE